MIVVLILSVIAAFCAGFVVGRAQALSILEEVEKLLNRQIKNFPVLVVDRKNGKGEAEEDSDEEGDPWKGN